MLTTRLRRSGLLFFAAGLALAAGCASNDSQPDMQSADLEPIQRRAVGPSQPYPADDFNDAEEQYLARSKRARREVAWRALAKVLKPIPLAEQKALISLSDPKTVPIFRTWLGGDELERMFVKMYKDLGKERRTKRDVPTDKEVQELFNWNATSIGVSSEVDYFDRISKIDNQTAVDGLGGNARAMYSPGYVRQYLTDYAAMLGCDGKLETLSPTTPPLSDSNFTNCFSREFAKDAAVIKVSWRRNDSVLHGIPVVDTSGAALKERLAGRVDEGGWPQSGLPMAEAKPSEIYTVKLEGGAAHSLAAIHLMTKELRHWMWITLWWSPKPEEDFGQDRPAEIQALGGPWGNYKMCVVTSYDEKDPDPRGGFSGSLGDALEAVHGTSTWCSNAFIEKGVHNAQTNCIGCHQHAGDVTAHPQILQNPEKFPQSGRTQIRASFPADYSWAFASAPSAGPKDRFQSMVSTRVHRYDEADRAE